MSYREHLPTGGWRGLVECGWTSGAGAADLVTDVLPDGCMDLVWTGTQLLVAGPDTGAHPAVRSAGVAAAGLRFAPGVLPALLGVPAAELRDRRVPLATLLPRLAPAVEERLARDVPAARDRSREHDVEALRVLAALAVELPGAPPEPEIRAVAARLGTGASAADTADTLGWTNRTLHRRCLAAFGYGPAVLRRVLRFRRAGALLTAGVAPAEVAARAGYADQPHLSREVRTLAGISPAALAARR
ncbi:helix-turn-helix domain-containing protein [Pseudonocardia sp.]|uniref:helix-turn-helix domain-containing protein n=1 Tax=Pseudonocardia sp. TaxID=60912 RepID=UPI003D149ECB